MNRRTAGLACSVLLLCGAAAGGAAPLRIEARSKSYFAVGMVQADQLVVHFSQLVDNAPVRDAAVGVSLRGVTVAAVAQPDGSYTASTPVLSAPGDARVVFAVTRQGTTETLSGQMPSSASKPIEAQGNSARQLGWWVLNFGVCIGFLWLFSRRKKSADT